jgi:hypothetical protein
VERSTAESKSRGVRDGHGLFKWGGSLRVHDTTYVGGTGLIEQFDSPLDIAVGELTVSIDPDDDLVPSRGNTEVQGGRRTPGWIVDYADPRIRGGKCGGDLRRSVAAGPKRNDHLELAGVFLIEHPADCRLEVSFLVQHWHDNRDTGPGCADSLLS